jgi:hypothetical protein
LYHLLSSKRFLQHTNTAVARGLATPVNRSCSWPSRALLRATHELIAHSYGKTLMPTSCCSNVCDQAQLRHCCCGRAVFTLTCSSNARACVTASSVYYNDGCNRISLGAHHMMAPTYFCASPNDFGSGLAGWGVCGTSKAVV